jgi:GNAT superfamily N-acetyltransferase
MVMDTRAYATTDRESCLEILAENTPEYFVPADRASLDEFLSNLPGPYFVVVDRDCIVACGGWASGQADDVVLTWGMVRRALHRKGIGRALLRFRLDAIEREAQAKVVRLHTVQLVQGFFAREGFVVVGVEPNGFGPGLDQVTMERRLVEG